MFQYLVIEETLFHQDIGTYTSYGIIALSEDREILKISDVSVNKDMVERMAKSYNELQLNPIHLYDVIEDAL